MAGGQHATRHRHGSQGALAQWALFRHLGSEVDAQPCWICVHQDANPDNGAGLQWGIGCSARPLGGGAAPTPASSALMPGGGSRGTADMGERTQAQSVLPFASPSPPMTTWGQMPLGGPSSLPMARVWVSWPGNREVTLRSDKVLPHPQPPSHLGPESCYHPRGQRGKTDQMPDPLHRYPQVLVLRGPQPHSPSVQLAGKGTAGLQPALLLLCCSARPGPAQPVNYFAQHFPMPTHH